MCNDSKVKNVVEFGRPAPGSSPLGSPALAATPWRRPRRIATSDLALAGPNSDPSLCLTPTARLSRGTMNSSRYCFDTGGVAGFRCALQKDSPERHFGRRIDPPFRCSVLSSTAKQKWNALLKSWGAPTRCHGPFRILRCLSRTGGNPSQTDALLISGSTVWAVEARADRATVSAGGETLDHANRAIRRWRLQRVGEKPPR